MTVLKQILLFEIIGGMLLKFQNTTMRAYGWNMVTKSNMWLVWFRRICICWNSQNDKIWRWCWFVYQWEISFYKRTDLYKLDDCMECVTIEIEKHNFEVDKNILVSVIYRPPNTDTDVFINTLNTFIEKIKPENRYCYLLGDYDINIFKKLCYA